MVDTCNSSGIHHRLFFFLENDGVIAAQKNVQDIETISNTGTMKHIFHIK